MLKTGLESLVMELCVIAILACYVMHPILLSREEVPCCNAVKRRPPWEVGGGRNGGNETCEKKLKLREFLT